MLRSPPTSPVDLLHVLSTPRAASALSLSLLWSWNYRTAPLHSFSRPSCVESLDFTCSVPPKVIIRRTHLEFVVFKAKFEVTRSRFLRRTLLEDVIIIAVVIVISISLILFDLLFDSYIGESVYAFGILGNRELVDRLGFGWWVFALVEEVHLQYMYYGWLFFFGWL